MKFYQENKVNPFASCLPLAAADPGPHLAVLHAADGPEDQHLRPAAASTTSTRSELAAQYTTLSPATAFSQLPVEKFVESTAADSVAPGLGEVPLHSGHHGQGHRRRPGRPDPALRRHPAGFDLDGDRAADPQPASADAAAAADLRGDLLSSTRPACSSTGSRPTSGRSASSTSCIRRQYRAAPLPKADECRPRGERERQGRTRGQAGARARARRRHGGGRRRGARGARAGASRARRHARHARRRSARVGADERRATDELTAEDSTRREAARGAPRGDRRRARARGGGRGRGATRTCSPGRLDGRATSACSSGATARRSTRSSISRSGSSCAARARRLRVVIDADGYRERRSEALRARGRRGRRRGRSSDGRAGARWQPMPAAERRIVHEHLRERGGCRDAQRGRRAATRRASVESRRSASQLEPRRRAFHVFPDGETICADGRTELSEFERGVVVGLLIGEGPFGGDGKQPQMTLRMHVRHEAPLSLARGALPASPPLRPLRPRRPQLLPVDGARPALVEDVLPLLEPRRSRRLDAHAAAERCARCASATPTSSRAMSA